MSESLIAAYGRSRSPQDLIYMEQLDWLPYVGGMSRFAMVAYLAGLIYDSEKYQAYIDCGMDGGGYFTVIHVYPLVAGLNYTIFATHGTLGARRITMAEMAEAQRVSLDTEISIKYPVAEIVSYQWQGDCLDKNLSVTAPPPLSLSADRRSILIGSPVYGTVAINYRSERHVYTLEVSGRDDAAENKYSSVVYCVYDGGPPEYLDIKPPPGAEEMDGDCGQGGGSTTIEPPGDDEPDWPDPHADRKTVYDWCDPHELISDSVTGV